MGKYLRNEKKLEKTHFLWAKSYAKYFSSLCYISYQRIKTINDLRSKLVYNGYRLSSIKWSERIDVVCGI